MMKKNILLSIVFFLALNVIFAADSKFAVVKVQRLIDDSKKGQILKENLKNRFQPQEEALKKKEEILKKLQSEIQSSLLKESVKEKKKIEFEDLQKIYTKESQFFLSEVRKAEQEQTRIILEELKKVVEKFGKKEGYDFIFEESLEQFILFSKNPLEDVTDELIKQYDKL